MAEKYEEKIFQSGIRSGKSDQVCMDWISEFNKSYQHFLDTGELIPFYIPKEIVDLAKDLAEKKGEE